MAKISWTDHVRNEEVLLQVNEQRNILHTTERKHVNWIGQILRRNWFLKHINKGNVEGHMKVTRRRERRRTQLLVDVK